MHTSLSIHTKFNEQSIAFKHSAIIIHYNIYILYIITKWQLCGHRSITTLHALNLIIHLFYFDKTISLVYACSSFTLLFHSYLKIWWMNGSMNKWTYHFFIYNCNIYIIFNISAYWIYQYINHININYMFRCYGKIRNNVYQLEMI